MDSKKIFICSTDPGSGRGGIATSVENILKGLDDVGIEYQLIVTHRTDLGKSQGIVVFLKALCILFISRISYFALGKSDPILFLHVGPSGSLLRKLILAVIGRILCMRVFSHHHSAQFERYLNGSSYIMRLALYAIARCSHMNLLLSEWWVDLYSLHGIHNVAVLPNSIYLDMPLSASSDKVGTTLLSMTRLVDEKRVDLVISALIFLPPDYCLIVAGDGPARAKLEGVVSSLGLNDRVKFWGWADPVDRIKLYSEADLFVLPSQFDSFGMVFIEALYSGCRVVAGPNPAVMAALPKINGVVYAEAFEPMAVANAIHIAVEAMVSPQYLRDAVVELYGVQSVTSRLLDLFQIKI